MFSLHGTKRFAARFRLLFHGSPCSLRRLQLRAFGVRWNKSERGCWAREDIESVRSPKFLHLFYKLAAKLCRPLHIALGLGAQ